MKHIYILLIFCFSFGSIIGQDHSVAREWNEELLAAIRNDFARPTVHARNLFHSSMLMYDAWALLDPTATTMFLGRNFGGFNVPFNGIQEPTDPEAAVHEAISYAMFRLLSHRFANSPNAEETLIALESRFLSYSYDPSFESTDYSDGSYAALGNYLAQQMIAFGLQDNANEQNEYENQFYEPVNEPLVLDLYEDNSEIDPNRWQPLAFEVFIDQSGNTFPTDVPDFLSPEWGQVTNFALDNNALEIFNVDGFDYYVFNNPGPPSYITEMSDPLDDPYKWGFALVASWSKHLDPADGVTIDISPASIGNIQSYPTNFAEYQQFYDFENGGDNGIGHAVNPATGLPYEPQMVPRGDYARVLAEFWADGPDSETPPGHWYTILNYVSDHPLLVKQLQGAGPVLEDLEWDVKLYILLGAAMHDSAVNTWGLKGYYDYIRPISALRYMASKGQSSDPTLQGYDPDGLPLLTGLTEIIEVGDPLAGDNNEHVGKCKVYAWKGPDYIDDPDTDVAGVDWILAERWWPYQRPTFVTPPFAGYISGHSTFSSAAAKILEMATGDPFFPGGMGTFDVAQNEFLVFEDGPSVDFTLQWATYKDASDQTSLSRIWGGIHPPIDDIPGRILGEGIGEDVFDKALDYFDGVLNVEEIEMKRYSMYPNPSSDEVFIEGLEHKPQHIQVLSIDGKLMEVSLDTHLNDNKIKLSVSALQAGIYFIQLTDPDNHIETLKLIKE
ncbi:T9SS type A sorting domain-containing protein [Aureisphaera galaxeae]|uniref:T9SS type A sorting domain-containing protein n=1 Tax=Aureisphaera galaxeae TaxID=1538023 RepID=UPI002350A781|nr:T9SS type A sorting domain-containing protein [Aureisphaera galaxeae]MDC8004049.1 T9SS type A sorting domain-containing protein [Aureisphaera galaxeae]